MYCLADNSHKFDRGVSKNTAKMAMPMTDLKNPHTFDPFGLISILGFLKKLKLACDTNGKHENAPMWLYHLFMNRSLYAALKARLSAHPTSRKASQKMNVQLKYLPTYPHVVNFQLEKYATYEQIAEMESAITLFGELATMNPSPYAEGLVKMTLRYRDVYEEYAFS